MFPCRKPCERLPALQSVIIHPLCSPCAALHAIFPSRNPPELCNCAVSTPPAYVGSVVTGKYDQGYLLNSNLLQDLNNTSNVPVHTGDHGSICGLGTNMRKVPVASIISRFGQNTVIGFQLLVGHLKSKMRRRMREVQKE